MQNQMKARGSVLFMLVGTMIILVALLYGCVGFRQMPLAAGASATQAPVPTVAGIVSFPTQAMPLPAIPYGLQNLILDAANQELLDTDGKPVFELDKAGTSWQPVVPPALLSSLGGLTLAKDQTGVWILAGKDGIPRYRWDEKSLSFTQAQDILANLPEFPKTDIALRYDEVQEALVDPQNVILFRFNKDSRQWVPTVPESLLKESGTMAPQQDSQGEWVVADTSGKALYTFSMQNATWEAVPPPAVKLPDIPESDYALTYDTSTRQLLQPDGSPAYLLDSRSRDWIPLIPTGIAAALPPGYKVTGEEGTWLINAADGVLIYRWDPSSLLWQSRQELGIAAGPTPAPETSVITSTVACKGALPTRLQVGDTVRVVTRLNLRSSPGILANLMRSHTAGTTLKVIGGPECIPQESGAYLWWNLQHPDGTQGWSAEGSLGGRFYFLEPVK